MLRKSSLIIFVFYWSPEENFVVFSDFNYATYDLIEHKDFKKFFLLHCEFGSAVSTILFYFSVRVERNSVKTIHSVIQKLRKHCGNYVAISQNPKRSCVVLWEKLKFLKNVWI